MKHVPWQLHSTDIFISQRGIQIIILGLALGLGAFYMRHILDLLLINLLPAKYKMLLYCGVLLVLAAILLAPFPGLAVLEFSYLLVLGITALLLTGLARCLPQLGWSVLGGLSTLLVLVHTVWGGSHLFWLWEFATRRDFAFGFANVRMFADVAVGLMPLVLLYSLARRRPSIFAGILCVLLLTFWWWLLWVAESRAALLGLFLGALVARILFGRSARWTILMLVLSSAFGLVGWWFLNPLGGGGGDEIFVRDISSDSGRLALWADALRYSIENFPLGIGPMGFAADGQLRNASAHNFFLNTAAEWGLPLALLLLVLLLYGCHVILRRARTMPQADKPLYACLVMAFIGVVVNAQFSGSHLNPMGALVMVFSIGLVFGYRASDKLAPPEPSGPVPLRATLVWAALMLMFAYMLYASIELYRLSVESTETCFEAIGRRYYYPRFWLQGRLECMQMVAPDHWLFWNWRD